MVGDWKAFLRSAIPEEELRDLREHGRTGRPLGSSTFLDRLERLVAARFETAETRSQAKTKTTQATNKETPELGTMPPNCPPNCPKARKTTDEYGFLNSSIVPDTRYGGFFCGRTGVTVPFLNRYCATPNKRIDSLHQ